MKNNAVKRNLCITRVVSRGFLTDIVERIRNFFGFRLRGYEFMANKAVLQIEEELSQKKVLVKWYRYEITQLTNGALMVMFYGETK